MEPFGIIGFIAILIAVMVYKSMEREKKRKDWKMLAMELKGRFTEPNHFVISARVPRKNLKLVIKERIVGTGKSSQLYTDISVTGPSILRNIYVVPEKGIGRIINTPDFRTGDADFDTRMIVGNRAFAGEAPEYAIPAAAVLGSETRNLFTNYDNRYEPSLRLDNGELSFTFHGAPELSVIRGAVRELAELSERFTVREEDIPKRILENFLTEPLPEVAFWFLETLVEFFAKSAEARTALAAAEKHSDPSIRSYAALMDTEGSFERTLLAAREDRARMKVRSRAVSTLVRFPPSPELFAELYTFLPDTNPEPLRLAALSVLAENGMRECVEKLLPYTEGLLADGEVKKAAREAVAKIQSRLGNAEAGRISVVDASDEAGRISVAEMPEEAGRIAVVEESVVKGQKTLSNTRSADG